MYRSVILSSAVVITLAAASVQAEVDVVTGNDYAPFTDEELPEGGLATELVVEAFAEMDRELNIDFRPWARGYHDTQQGVFAGTFPYVHSEERAEEMLYSEQPLANIANIVVSTAEDAVEYDGPASLEGLTLCYALGYALPPVVDEMIEQGAIDTHEIEDIERCPRLMELDRADFFIPTNFTWPALVESEGLDADAFHVSDKPLDEQGLYFITARSDLGEATLELFDEGLQRLHDAGHYESIVASHVGEAFEE